LGLKRTAKAKPPKTLRKTESSNLAVDPTLNERQTSQPNMKGVDFIEESKDYQRVIHDLNDLLNNPRQAKPLGASSTSHISYHTHRVPPRLNPQPGRDNYSPPAKSRQGESISPGKMSPRVMKMIKGQLLVSQKR